MHNKGVSVLWGSRLGDFMSNKALRYGPNMTLAALLEMQDKGTKRQINCHQVGEIVSFDPATQTAEVKVKMSFLLNGKITEYPLLLDCPCIILSGNLGRLTFPINKGDSCLVLFNDRDMDNWYSGGQTMPPRTDRLHDFSDAIALVGLRNKQNEISDYFTQGTEIKYDNSTIKLETDKITITNQQSTVVMQGGTTTVTSPIINVTGNVNVVQNNVDDNSLHAYIIASYHSGTDWYRVYSDKWVEQGGVRKRGGESNAVTFLVPMADTNYFCTAHRCLTGGLTSDSNSASRAGADAIAGGIYNKATTGFTIRMNPNYGSSSDTYTWEVKGYKA